MRFLSEAIVIITMIKTMKMMSRRRPAHLVLSEAVVMEELAFPDATEKKKSIGSLVE